MSSNALEVRVTPRGAARVRSNHPWVFRDDLASSPAAGNGDLLRVTTPSGEPLGHAFYSTRSKIALRLAAGVGPAPDAAFWAERVRQALAYRARVVQDTDAWRMIFGESDGIPGLVADRYGAHVVVQTLTMGAERILEPVLAAIAEELEVASVLARNDSAVRELEGLPREVVQLRGQTPERIEVREGALRYLADPFRGQKTGAFLDQRENRLAAAGHARGRVLDVFSYHGSFALHAARTADEVVAIESSAEAVARGRANAALNALTNVSFVEANAFEDLRARRHTGERFDTIFVDPPAFAKNRSDLAAARRGYKEINLRAMQLLTPEGVLVTSSCSYNLKEAELQELLAAAAADARRGFRIVEKRSQARDHPLRLGFPESHYLKCLVLCPL